jgi:hypothetical protein
MPSNSVTSPTVTIPSSTDTPLVSHWDNPYSDVKDTDWFYEAVRFAAEEKLMDGTGGGKFSPYATMSRAMLVTVLYRLEGQPTVTGSIPFADVQDGQWYSNAVIWAAENGIVDGYVNGTFGWNDIVTREQLVTILYRYAKSKNLDVGASADLSRFTDVGDISDWALDAMKWAVAAGIIQGRTPVAAAPKESTTRAEVVTIFRRYVENSVLADLSHT